ncbi:MAG: tripartite tricarboxylate transporter substrate binding protein BugE [Betaproteobacteria bacterium]|jgi:tripartite-type tricarboxylate transporter receptor subunit TctC|nr:tripartite tricarboxylate transporter substrate binding protein BugE [Burkholderiaceae bacterium]MCZ8109368.1 tripartite tricarboxylate transporter substrate binding protein BugE [Rubrivivax sp.]
MDRRQHLGALLAAAAGTTLPLAARAQAYPNKAVRLIVPFAPGGTTDIIARIVAERMQSTIGQNMVVENRAGGGGTVGTLEVVRAAPDGYVLGMGTVSSTAANPAINPRIQYDPLVDLTPISNIAATPNVIAVHPSFPAKDFKGFVEALRRNPGRYSYASSGTGGNNHLLMELFKVLTKTFVLHIPYRGSGPAINDTVAGQVQVLFDNLPSSLPFIRDGRMVPIVVAAPERLAVLPNVPTFKEVGLEPVNRLAFYGFVGPKGLPREVVDRIHAATRTIVQDAGVRRRIEDTGSVILANTPAEFAAQIRAELEVFRRVVRDQKLTLE